ncbi:hypothetical protein NE237_022440 [Protea cynaroides]|uniref:Uncharacterized protein n=1 Tax=Protea cynaroides TaxID=273540 RepID=A0A9Q0HC29_9MAGN|nr:hypothetical protein NE237_022440 [Protea cynaroides]
MSKSPEEEHPRKAFGWAARDNSGVLSPFKFSRSKRRRRRDIPALLWDLPLRPSRRQKRIGNFFLSYGPRTRDCRGSNRGGEQRNKIQSWPQSWGRVLGGSFVTPATTARTTLRTTAPTKS